MGPDRFERLSRLLQCGLLVRQDGQALGLHCAEIAKCAGVAFDCAALLVLLVRLHRDWFELASLRAEVSEDGLGRFGNPPNYLHDSWMDFLYWDAELEA